MGREVSQRERMLTAFIRIAPAINTAWYLKVDTDVVVSAAGAVIDPEWLQRDASGAVPSLVASPWGYTKPGDWVDDLQAWADQHPQLQQYPRLELPSGRGQRRFGHPRICSWICLINTAFGVLANSLAPPPGPLPVPSQDTYHWYVAARRQERIQKVRFKRRGWHTISKDRVRAEMVRTLINGEV